MDKIIIKGARENNLKNIDLELPKNKLIVMTGVSGSGKSSLAFDTIYLLKDYLLVFRLIKKQLIIIQEVQLVL